MWRWIDVDRVTAFKRDLLTTDAICVSIESHGLTVEIDEDVDGWEAFLTALPAHLKGAMAREQILAAVVHPAFKENRTVVFERCARSGESGE